jgi:WD40 repeat protein
MAWSSSAGLHLTTQLHPPSNPTIQGESKTCLSYAAVSIGGLSRWSIKWGRLNKASRRGCVPQDAANFTKGVKFSPDGTCLLTASEDNILRVFEVPTEVYRQASGQEVG